MSLLPYVLKLVRIAGCSFAKFSLFILFPTPPIRWRPLSLHQNHSRPSHQQLHTANSNCQQPVQNHRTGLLPASSSEHSSLGFQATTLSSVPPTSWPFLLILLHVPLLTSQPLQPGGCRAQHLGLLSTCPTPTIQSQQTPITHWWVLDFCLQLEAHSELQSHRSKCLLILFTWIPGRQ